MSRFHTRVFLAAALLALPFSLPSSADPGGVVAPAPPVYEPPRWGVGIQLGAPTGFSAKRYLGQNAFDMYLGVAYGPGLRLGGDYLWGIAQLVNNGSLNLDFHLGAGGFVGSLNGPCGGFYNGQGNCNGDSYVGARAPVGLEMVFKGSPLSLGLELAPGVAFAPSRAGFVFDGDLSLRLLL